MTWKQGSTHQIGHFTVCSLPLTRRETDMYIVHIMMLISYVNVAVCVTGAHMMMILNSIVNVNDPQEHLDLEF